MTSYDIWKLAEPDIKLELTDEYKTNQVENYMSQYFLSDEKINLIKNELVTEIENGLKRSDETAVQDSTVLGMKMTFYTELFNGAESGKYVVMYLNSRHLLLILAKVRPGFPVKTEREYFIVSENVRRSPYIKIFEYLCDCMLRFFSKHHLLGKTRNVGFCSDLPMVQFGLDHCIVWYFTDSASAFPLNCYDVNQCFEIVLLKERYKDLKINLVAVVNDCTSRFIHSSYVHGHTDLFLNLKNDCDLLYWEDFDKVEKWRGPEKKPESVLIDTELRNFGGNGCLDFVSTDLEWLGIATSLKSNKHARMEKFVSEQYLLELIKQILVDLQHNLLYCRNADLRTLQEGGISLTELCTFANNKRLEHLVLLLPGGTIGGSQDDAKIVRYVCKVVLIRAAVFISVCLASVMTRFQKDDFMISVNCPLLQKYCDFETYVRNVMTKLAPEKKFQFLWSEDNSVYEGAALATSIAHRVDRTIEY